MTDLPISIHDSHEAAITCTFPVGVCPFREGPETLDLLLAEIGVGTGDSAALDAALDLRSLMTARRDAAACVRQLFHLRALLDGRCYLALFRVRCWLRREIQAEVRTWRGEPWQPIPVPFGCGRFEELVNVCLASLGLGPHGWPATAAVRFRFVERTPALVEVC